MSTSEAEQHRESMAPVWCRMDVEPLNPVAAPMPGLGGGQAIRWGEDMRRRVAGVIHIYTETDLILRVSLYFAVVFEKNEY
jgi:hypothetical protein